MPIPKTADATASADGQLMARAPTDFVEAFAVARTRPVFFGAFGFNGGCKARHHRARLLAAGARKPRLLRLGWSKQGAQLELRGDPPREAAGRLCVSSFGQRRPTFELEAGVSTVSMSACRAVWVRGWRRRPARSQMLPPPWTATRCSAPPSSSSRARARTGCSATRRATVMTACASLSASVRTDLELHASSDESPLVTARRFCETSALAELRAALGEAVRSAGTA